MKVIGLAFCLPFFILYTSNIAVVYAAEGSIRYVVTTGFVRDVLIEFLSIAAVTSLLALFNINFVRQKFSGLSPSIKYPHLIGGALEEEVKRQAGLPPEQLAIYNKISAKASLNARVEALRYRSTVVLFTIGGLLVCSALIIIFAGMFANIDQVAVSNIDKLSREIQDLDVTITNLTNLQLQVGKDLGSGTAPSEDIKVKELRQSLPFYTEDPITIKALLAALAIRQSNDTGLLKTAWDLEVKERKGLNDNKYVTMTIVIRVGIVLVIVFLVQILVGLFRYISRLITFYNAQLDVLELWSGKDGELEKYWKLLVPKIEFDKEPKHPIDEIVQKLIAKIPNFDRLSSNSVDTASAKKSE